ncbi:Hypothetical protein CINCED_3A000974 [Cinara cedri]|uniref:Cilia- and flagella-associated protein 58 central coiled coil domain-containing protein n=1 Tax=Cinara cedri TaxID=506608 RepID=A0A5E4NSH4_9HEMI|nr:Hypothetical protein CINCED_3A000974 [Cinara cedri]
MEKKSAMEPDVEYERILEFSPDPPLEDTLGNLWIAVRKLGQECVRYVGDRTRMVDVCRQLIPIIKQSIISERMKTEKLEQQLISAHSTLDASNLREQIIQESNDNLLAQIKTLKNELDEKTKQMEEEGLFSSMGQGDTSQIELTRTKRELTRADAENKRLDSLCESLKKELDAAEYNVRDLEADLAAQSNNLVKELKTMEKLEDRIKIDHEQMEKLKSELFSKLNRELKIKTELRADNVQEINRLQDKINFQEDELLRVQSELTRLIATHETTVRKRQEVTEEMEKMSERKNNAENNIATLERNLNTSQEENIRLKSLLELSAREKKLHQEISTLKRQIHEDSANLNRKDVEIQELKKEVNSWSDKLKDQDHDLNTIKTERNLFFKNLAETKDEMDEMKNKIKMISQQLEQQKDYVAYKEMQLTKNDAVLKQTEKELQKCQQEIDKYETKVEETSNLLKKKNEDKKSMITTFKILQKKIEKLQKQNHEANEAKNKLINQINIRNEELLKQKDTNDILRTTLGKGETEYNKRIDDIRLLKLEVKRLSDQKNLLMKNLSEINDVRGEVLKYEQTLNRERLKCRALEEMLLKPTNVHHWRLLKNTDPPAYEMTVKVRILQKRLLEQCTKVFDKNLQVQEIQTRYEKLKDEFVKLPGTDVFKEMNNIKRTLLKKEDKMRRLSGELIISQQTAKEYMFNLERTKRELNEFKNKYFEMKGIIAKIKTKNKNITSSNKPANMVSTSYGFSDMAI